MPIVAALLGLSEMGAAACYVAGFILGVRVTIFAIHFIRRGL